MSRRLGLGEDNYEALKIRTGGALGGISPGQYSNTLLVDANSTDAYPTLTAAVTAAGAPGSTARTAIIIHGNTTEPAGVITIPQFVSVIGSKKDTNIICDGLRIGDGTTLQHRAEFVNIYVSNLGAGTIGMDFDAADEIILRGCGISGFATGLKIDHYTSGLFQMDDCSVANSTIGIDVQSAYSMHVRGCNLYNNATAINVQVCMSLSITDSAFETFDTAILFNNTPTAVSALSIVIHNCRFLSASGGGSFTCRAVKSYCAADGYQGVVRGLVLRDCAFWLTNAKYVIEVNWNGYLSGGAMRFIATLDDCYIQGDPNTINTTAWIKSDCASDGFVNIAVGNLLADDTILVQDGVQPIVTGYGHFGLDQGSVAGVSNGAGVLWGKNRWGSDGTDATRITHGFTNLTAGTATVLTTTVTNNSMIFLSENSQWGNGYLWVSARSAGTSFTIQSSGTADTCLVAWMLIEP